MNGWVNGWMDGWVDGWMGGWMVGESPAVVPAPDAVWDHVLQAARNRHRLWRQADRADGPQVLGVGAQQVLAELDASLRIA